ncbi:CDP-alcohol phosphatidyltransferase family protein [Methanobacterium aggregans]|uniref:CDP-alcohol phosphatidyltransferase family protein n=1 Tax=Methanobacterium aggregans TaxID=1615586 RepID=UPI001AE5784C|nr:CDP-alcohol phosphatidyltransferase family protein [Methanobacterium aggregans]MBP2045726.1 CDP-diacylglycerol--glycerol-3-phosphate 3-phosphatidyltransferase/cardiolipin synthase [Methanobacterium aggregans]
MFKRSFIPSGVSSIRFLIAPLFVFTFFKGLYSISMILFAFACFTDFMDGYIARKMNSTSNAGAYMDVLADFVLILVCFSAFVLVGWYDPMVLVLIITMFSLFIATSGLETPVYDPVGKYLGAFLMGMVVISLLLPQPSVRQILMISLTLFCLSSILSRLFFFYRNPDN